MARFRKYMSAEKLARPFPKNALDRISALARGDETVHEQALASATITHLLYPNHRQHPALLFVDALRSGDAAAIASTRAAVLALEA